MDDGIWSVCVCVSKKIHRCALIWRWSFKYAFNHLVDIIQVRENGNDCCHTQKSIRVFFFLLTLWIYGFDVFVTASNMFGDRPHSLSEEPFFPLAGKSHTCLSCTRNWGQSKHFDIVKHSFKSTYTKLQKRRGDWKRERKETQHTNRPLIAFLWTRCPHHIGSVRLFHMQSVPHTITNRNSTLFYNDFIIWLVIRFGVTNEILVGKLQKKNYLCHRVFRK